MMAGNSIRVFSWREKVPENNQSYPLPPINQRIHIQENYRHGNSLIRKWTGTIIAETNELFVVRMDSGYCECFRKIDFKIGKLIFKNI